MKFRGDLVSICDLLMKIDPQIKIPWMQPDPFYCGGDSRYTIAKKMAASGDYPETINDCYGYVTFGLDQAGELRITQLEICRC